VPAKRPGLCWQQSTCWGSVELVMPTSLRVTLHPAVFLLPQDVHAQSLPGDLAAGTTHQVGCLWGPAGIRDRQSAHGQSLVGPTCQCKDAAACNFTCTTATESLSGHDGEPRCKDKAGPLYALRAHMRCEDGKARSSVLQRPIR